MPGSAVHRFFRRDAHAAVLLLGLAASSGAEVFLTIGEGRALVRETRTVSVVRGPQPLVLEDLPAGIDLSTLVVRARRLDVDVREWGRAGASAAAGGTNLVWTPAPSSVAQSAAPAGPVSVEARIDVPDERQALDLEVFYETSGLTWSASYQVVVRGDRVEEREPLSADLAGWVRIENRAGRAFSNAVIRLVGRRRPPDDEAKPPGFLLLDELNPLFDLWRWRPPEPGIEYEYALPGRLELPAGSDTEFLLVKSARIPAARRYVLRAEDFSASLESPPRPLRKFIGVPNTAAHRLGIPLPPGPVQLFLGSLRSQLLQTGDLPHTPVDADLRIDLGPAGDVTGRRGSLGRAPLPDGAYSETFRIEVLNDRDGAITVELDEKPPLILEWSLVSSTKPCREVFRRLLYEFDVPAGGREAVEYNVRVKQPVF